MRSFVTSMKSTVGLFFVVFNLCATTITIGPQKQYSTIGSMNWSTVQPGDSVLIYYQSEPYKEKWVICCKGTANQPIVISGVANSQGLLPIIDGKDAITNSQFNYWNQERGVIKIGGSNKPADTLPEHIIIQNLDICNGNDENSFTGRDGITSYAKNAAAIYIEKGNTISIYKCIFRQCGNGLFASHESKKVRISGCYFFDNGNINSIYEHNNYTEASGILFEYNRFGPLRQGAQGNNLKDRSSGCIIRYNWIEGGNRQLDLVESDYSTIYQDTSYRKTVVYGNILIEHDDNGNSQIVHYGGDGDDQTRYRKGTLYFYNNTVISLRSNTTTLIRLSTDEEHADIRNTIYYCTASGNNCAISNSAGRCVLSGNWIKSGWVKSHSNNQAIVIDSLATISTTPVGFINESTQNYGLTVTSPCIDHGVPLNSYCQSMHPLLNIYSKHQKSEVRTSVGSSLDIGAFEYSSTKTISIPPQKNPMGISVSLRSHSNSLVMTILQPNAPIHSISLFTVRGQSILSIENPIPTNSYCYTVKLPVTMTVSTILAYQLVWKHEATPVTGFAFVRSCQ